MFMNFFFIILAIVSVVHLSNAARWPSELQRCSRNDPALDKCLFDSLNHALASVAKGLPKVGMKSLDPLQNVGFTFSVGQGPVTGSVANDGVTISGTSKMHVNSVHYNNKTREIELDSAYQSLLMTGNYKVNANILVFPLVSTGRYAIELIGLLANHSIKFGNDLRDKSHGAIKFRIYDLKLLKFTLIDSKLNNEANNVINSVVNNNWEIIKEATKSSMQTIVEKVYGAALKPLIGKFTFDEMLPEHV